MRQCVCIYRNKKKEGRGGRKGEGGMKKGKKEERKRKSYTKLHKVMNLSQRKNKVSDPDSTLLSLI